MSDPENTPPITAKESETKTKPKPKPMTTANTSATHVAKPLRLSETSSHSSRSTTHSLRPYGTTPDGSSCMF